MEQLMIAVLMGGVSKEREVSLKSGAGVANALRSMGHQVAEVDVREESLEEVADLQPDVAFIALHGRYGEDGGAQADLERLGIAYTGSGVHASRTGMDKMASKCAFLKHDIPTPPFRLVSSKQEWAELTAAVHEVGLPAVIKPTRQGSSIGVAIARNRDQAAEGLAQAFAYGSQAIIERYIRGRELTVGILEDRALPLIELKPKQAFFDYTAKYEDAATEFIVEPDLAEDLHEEIQRSAVGAHRAICCEGHSRVDMILENDGCHTVLEVNTVPGMTERSSLPRAARAVGITFPELCDTIVWQSLRRHAPETAEAHMAAASG